VNEAALVAARQNRKKSSCSSISNWPRQGDHGVERRSLILSDEEKKNTAYHEAGTRWWRL